MRIASLGRKINHPTVQFVEFASAVTLLDFDALLIDPDAVRNELANTFPTYAAGTGLNYQQAHWCRAHFKRRRQELAEFGALGRPIVAFCGANSSITVSHPNEADIALGDYLPGTGRNFWPSTGDNIAFDGPLPYKDFWTEVHGILRYTAIIDPAPGRPMFFLKGTKKVVGAVVHDAGGWTFLCPKVKANVGPQSNNDQRFVGAIEKLLAAIASLRTPFTPPDWQREHTLLEEAPLLMLREQQATTLRTAEQALAATQSRLDELDTLKRLFTAKGDALVEAVTAVLSKLGLNVEPGPEVKDDLIAKGFGLVFVIEVKGRDKTGAAEKDARQLESWVSRYAHEHTDEPEPKGLLIINGYRDLKLAERNEPVFPHAMHDYLIRKGQCAISGVQLLCAVMEAIENHSEEQVCRELAATSGVFVRYGGRDWSQRITPKNN